MDERAPVLIVDDDPVIREALREWLEEDGYAVWEAETASTRFTEMGPESPRLESGDEWPLACPTSICYTAATTGCTRAQVRRGSEGSSVNLPSGKTCGVGP